MIVRRAFRDRLRGVDEQVEEQLRDPTLVPDHDRGRLELEHEPRAMTDLVLRHLDRGFERPAQIDRLGLVLLDPRKHLQTPHDRAHSIRARARVTHHRQERAKRRMIAGRERFGDRLGHQIEVPDHERERVC